MIGRNCRILGWFDVQSDLEAGENALLGSWFLIAQNVARGLLSWTVDGANPDC
jgi:hypothetical protein